jgi:SAM-dependent methyltransferase
MDSLQRAHEKTRRAYNLAAQSYHDLFHDEMARKEYDRNLLDAFAARFPKGALLCDAGCGPSGHIGRYLRDKGLNVVGVDIADRCVELARAANPGMRFEREDIARLTFSAGSFDGIVSYYSIIHTPKDSIGKMFDEFHRTLKPGGWLLVAVKAGTGEGYRDELLGIKTDIFFAFFAEDEIAGYFERSRFRLESIEKRNPYDFEIGNERIFAVGRKA